MLRNNRGFSLIEVLVTVGLIGILVSIALPSYNKYKGNTLTMAIKADLANGHKAYSAYDATNGSFCASLSSAGMNVQMTSTTYRKGGFYGFGAVNADCAGDPDDDQVSVKNEGYCRNETNDQIDATFTSATTCNAADDRNWEAANAFNGIISACILGADTFTLGAYTNTSALNTFLMINQSGKVHSVQGTTCTVVP